MHTTIDRLGEDHRTVLTRLHEVEAGAAALEAFLAFLGNELEAHLGLEEEALFPVLARHPQLAAGPVAVMEAEHDELRRLAAALDAALRDAGDAQQPKAVAQAIIGLLRAHIDKEDHVLFPVAEQLLTAAEWNDVEVGAAGRT